MKKHIACKKKKSNFIHTSEVDQVNKRIVLVFQNALRKTMDEMIPIILNKDVTINRDC